MDFGRTDAEAELTLRVQQLAEAAGSPADLLALASAGEVMVDLEEAICSPATARAPLHQRLLVVEEAARLGLPALPGPRLLVGADIDEVAAGRVTVVDRQRPGPSRHAPLAHRAIVLDGVDGWALDLTDRAVTRVDSSFGYPYGVVPAGDGTRLAPEVAARARSRWQLGLAAEIAGTASGGLAHVVTYLRDREQFGRRLADFQALRHRVAELAVTTEAAVWLAREAAWHGDAGRAGLAVSYARDLAAAMVPELVQLSGARGFVSELPVHLFAVRLEGLRLEIGSADRVAREVAAARR